jgi:hypothetical protein
LNPVAASQLIRRHKKLAQPSRTHKAIRAAQTNKRWNLAYYRITYITKERLTTSLLSSLFQTQHWEWPDRDCCASTTIQLQIMRCTEQHRKRGRYLLLRSTPLKKRPYFSRRLEASL